MPASGASSRHVERDGQFVLLDVRLDKLDVSPALRRLGASLQQAAAQGQATGNG